MRAGWRNAGWWSFVLAGLAACWTDRVGADGRPYTTVNYPAFQISAGAVDGATSPSAWGGAVGETTLTPHGWGPSLAASFGHRRRATVFGGRIAWDHFSGDEGWSRLESSDIRSVHLDDFDVQAAISHEAGFVWIGAGLGLRYEHISDGRLSPGFGGTLELGFGRRIGVAFDLSGGAINAWMYGAVGIAMAYRR